MTPQTGKRKRASTHALPRTAHDSHVDGDVDVDELSPERDQNASSVKKSATIAKTVSPVRDAVDEDQDELSFIADQGASTARKPTADASPSTHATPAASTTTKRASSARATEKTPTANRSGSIPTTAPQSIARRSKSTDPGPITPGTLANGRPRFPPTSPLGVDFTTIGLAPEDESEDELATPKVNGTVSQSATRARQSPVVLHDDADMGEDELSSPTQPNTAQQSTIAEEVIVEETPTQEPAVEATVAHQSAKHGTTQRVSREGEAGTSSALVPVNPPKRGRPRKLVEEKEKEARTVATPVVRKPARKRDAQTIAEEGDDQLLDELSPETERTTQRTVKPAPAKQNDLELSDEDNEDEYEEPEEPDPTPRPTTKRHSPGHTQRAKATSDKPPRKRQRFSGPKQAISVMRIKGSTVRGITVADTTRTLLEETIDHRLARIAEKMQASQDRDRRKELRSQINLSLSFKESLNEKLLDLQDANDVLTSNFKRSKMFKRDNAELRREILTLQNSRQEIALEHDNVQAKYEAQKAKVEARNTLSANMFEIEAAIQNGRRKAQAEGRDNEGPELPLSMLLETVGRDVGSFGGGLLASVRSFNGMLERAAGWLEGRA